MANREPEPKPDTDTSTPAGPRHVARHVVEEYGQIYTPGQELPAGMTPRRHELLTAGLVGEPNQEEG